MASNFIQTWNDGGRGFRYEHKMTALIALRLLQDWGDFIIASNFKEAGKFDDIVFSYLNTANQRISWFIQVKHKINPEKKRVTMSDFSLSEDYSIRKYFDSYKAITNKKEKDNEIFKTLPHNMVFALFTNAIMDFEVQRQCQKVDVDMLTTNGIKEKNIVFKNANIFRGISNRGLGKFLRQFFVCSQQASEQDLDQLIMNELNVVKERLNTVTLKLVTFEWISYIQRWCTLGPKARFLRKREVEETLNKFVQEAQPTVQKGESAMFVSSFLKKIKAELERDTLIHYVSDSDNTSICMDALHQIRLTEPPNIWIPLQHLSQDNQLPLQNYNWKNKDGCTLVIDCDDDLFAIDEVRVSNFITQLTEINPKNRIVIVSTKGNIAAKNISIRVNAVQKNFLCTLKDMSVTSRKKLMEREVLFQGVQIKISSLLPLDLNSLDNVFDMSSLSVLQKGSRLDVGKTVEETPQFYLPLTLLKNFNVQDFLTQSNETLALSFIPHISMKVARLSFPQAVTSTSLLQSPQKNQNKQFIVLQGNPEEAFNEVATIVNRPIHWFQKNKDKWVWRQSKNLIQDTPNQNFDETHVVNMLNIKEKVVIVSGEPGMGKSTLLNILQAKKFDPSFWIVNISLNDLRKQIKNDFLQNVQKNTKDLIAAAAGVNKNAPKFCQLLFGYYYHVSGKMIIFLDGFDEITPDYTEEGLALVNALKTSKVAQIWITTRTNSSHLLEKVPNSQLYSIKPLDEEEQKNYLENYFKTKLSNENENKIDELVNQLLLKVNKMHKGFGTMLQVPLQLNILADVMVDMKEARLKDNLNVFYIVREFIRVKRAIQREKVKLSMPIFEQERLETMRENDIMNLALLVLIPPEILLRIPSAVLNKNHNQFKKLVADGHEKSGFLLFFTGEKPEFINLIFAEYFTSLFFAKNNNECRNFLASDMYFSSSFTSVRYFFDRILSSGQKLHEAVLNKDLALVKSLLSAANVTDDGGRTALHLAAATPHTAQIISALLDAGARVDAPDTTLNWTPMQYALRIKAVENIAPLLEMSEQVLDANAVPITWNTLLLAVKGDYLRLFRHLLENGIFAVECLDNLDPRKWITEEVSHGLMILHVAAAYNSVKILRYLLRKDTRDSKAKLIESKDEAGRTPLLMAVWRKSFDAAFVLLESGANCRAMADGKTIFEIAAKGNNCSDVTIEDTKENTVKEFWIGKRESYRNWPKNQPPKGSKKIQFSGSDTEQNYREQKDQAVQARDRKTWQSWYREKTKKKKFWIK